jgi:hypothetical protein
MKHSLQKEGWQKMNTILDREMPIEKKRNRYLLPFCILLAITTGALILGLHYDQSPNKILPKSIFKNEASTSIADSNELVSQNAELPVIEPHKIQQKKKANAETTENNLGTKSTHSQTQAKATIGVQLSNNMKAATKEVSKRSKSEEKRSINQIPSPAESRSHESKNEIVKNNNTDISTSTLENKHNTLLRIHPVHRIPSNVKIENLSYYLQTKIKVTKHVPNQNLNFGLAAGVGQNSGYKKTQDVWAKVIASRSLSKKTNLYATAGFSLYRINIEPLYISSKNFEERYNEPSIINGNPINGFDPIQVVLADLSIGASRQLYRRLKIGLGCGLSYLISIKNEDITLPGALSIGLEQKIHSQLVKDFTNKIYLSPELRIEYKINDRWTAMGQYSHDLTGINKAPISEENQFYFREIKLGFTYAL